MDAAAAGDLAPGVWERGRPDAHSGPPAAFAFPLPGVGVMGFSTAAPLEPDATLLATMDSLGSQISQFVERCRAQADLRESDARKSAILNAAFDCIITMDHHGNVVEVNRATERTFGYRAGGDDRARAGRADRPARLARGAPARARALRANRPRGVRRPPGRGAGHARGRQRVPGRADRHPRRPPRPAAVLRLPARRDRGARARARPAPARRPSRPRCGGWRRRSPPAPTRGTRSRSSPRRSGGCSDAQSSNMVRFDDELHATVVGAWNEGDVQNVPVGDTVRMDGDTASTRVFRTGAPARVDSYADIPGELSARLRASGFTSAVAAPIFLSGRLWGAVIVSSVVDEPFPPGAEQRIADFAELAAQALANAQARADLAASRARIVQAGDAERRRLERNLHDGAQQRLVSLALMLRLAARRHPDDGDLERRRRRALARAEGAARAGARHPSRRADRARAGAGGAGAGRPRAAAGRARRLHPRAAARSRRGGRVLRRRRGADQRGQVRAGVRRSASSSSAGTAMPASRCATTGSAARSPGRGSGLRGLADRVEALGGRLVVDSPAGAGTTLRAEIPCS